MKQALAISSELDLATAGAAGGVVGAGMSGRYTAEDDDRMPEPGTPDWTELVLRVARARDRAAFVILFRHFAPRVKSYLLRHGASDGQAEEATQEAMATLWHRAPLYDPAKAAVSTWIFTIARNKQLDALRRRKRPEPEMLPEIHPAAEAQAEDSEVLLGLAQESDLLRDALEKLPPKQKAMIEKAYFGDLTHAEISQDTNLPLGTIKSRIRLGLERLRHEIGPMMRDRDET